MPITRGDRGLAWDEMLPGSRIRTFGRTVTEGEIAQFVAQMGFMEPLFLDMRTIDESPIFDRRVAPGALVYCLAEGLVMQTGMLHGTGLAFLGMGLKALSPTYVGDTIEVEVEVIEARPSSTDGQGVVVTKNVVYNQDGRALIEYTPARLLLSKSSIG